MSEPVTDFFACEHPMSAKYVVSTGGILCTGCDPNWDVTPLLTFTPQLLLRSRQPMTQDDEARVREALKRLTKPLEEGQTVELAGITFTVVRP